MSSTLGVVLPGRAGWPPTPSNYVIPAASSTSQCKCNDPIIVGISDTGTIDKRREEFPAVNNHSNNNNNNNNTTG